MLEEILAGIWETIALVFKPITNLFSNIVWIFNDIGNLLNRFLSSFVSIIKFIIDFIKFIWFAVKTIFNYLYKAFDNIFWDWLFDPIQTWFNNLSVYLWSGWTVIFISLLVLSFFLIIFWFIMRVIKWQVNYNSAVKHLDKQRSKK